MSGSETRKKRWADEKGTAAAQRWATSKTTPAGFRGGRTRKR